MKAHKTIRLTLAALASSGLCACSSGKYVEESPNFSLLKQETSVAPQTAIPSQKLSDQAETVSVLPGFGKPDFGLGITIGGFHLGRVTQSDVGLRD
jgi:hypothetical protein